MSAPPKAPTATPTSSAAPVKRSAILPAIQDVQKFGERIITYAEGGVGKTSFFAYWPNSAIIEVAEETGYSTLRRHNKVPEIPSCQVNTFDELQSTCRALAESDQPPYDLVAFDGAFTMDKIIKDHTCATQFGNDWKEYEAWGQQGDRVNVTEWNRIIYWLDRIRMRGTHVVLIGHARVSTTKNPTGDDFASYRINLGKESRERLINWADSVFFISWEHSVDDKTKKAAKNGSVRVLNCEGAGAFRAKNRFSMPSEILLPEDPSKMWSCIADYINTKEK